MDRFTTYKNGWRVLGDGAYMDDALSIRGEAIDLLAAYEDTGLTPDEVDQIRRASQTMMFPTVGDFVRYAIQNFEELEKYRKAEADGRLIVLPCKEGTPLYCDGKLFASHCAGQVHEVKDWYYSPVMIYKDFRGEHDYVIDPDSIGVTVYLTREEAEAALKEAHDG